MESTVKDIDNGMIKVTGLHITDSKEPSLGTPTVRNNSFTTEIV
jgi:hypothetical protein